ncbi:MAG TPA: hypothetical protein VJX93_03640 [Candidatus Methanomethylophilaceae archaeon]|nr:hypothetical protein [Candidatus Methanomethylophilaceae archaeon]
MVTGEKQPGTGCANTRHGSSAGSERKRRKFKPKVKTTARRQSMLNMHKINSFKYDMNDILETTSMDEEKASAFLASIIAKASRNSTKEAKEYVKTFLEEEELLKTEHDKINRLLDKYSKYR